MDQSVEISPAEPMDTDRPKQPTASSSKSYELPWVSDYRRQAGSTLCLQSCWGHSPVQEQVEKYRPTLISEIVGNKDAVERLQVISEEGNMPNLILSVRPLC